MNAIKAKAAASCCQKRVMLYADGELDPPHAVEVEEHVKRCEPCHTHLELIKSMRASLRRSCARRAPTSVEARMRSVLGSCLDAPSAEHVARVVEARPSDAEFPAKYAGTSQKPRSRRNNIAVVGAFAFAACLVVVFVMRDESRPRSVAQELATAPTFQVVASKLNSSKLDATRLDGSRLASSRAANDEGASLDALLEELVSQHANPLPPEEKNPEDLTRLEPYVGVPVRRPALTILRAPKGESPSFDGARIHPLRDSKTAAALQYKLKGHRLTVYVFDPHKIPIKRTRLRPRVVREAPVYVGHMRGFNVAAAERSGVGYAIASDLDEDKSVQMVASF